MDQKRCSTPPPSEAAHHQLLALPQTPGAPRDALPRTMIPPSPGVPRLGALAANSKRSARVRAPAASSKRSQTAGVKKPASKTAKTKIDIAKAMDDVADSKKSISFMDLPGEIRNLIYSFTRQNSSQALLVYRPRLASLRSRTQLDRHRTLASDVIEKEQEADLPASGRGGRTRANKRKPKTALLPRETNRPFFGLTQVCSLLRQEFRPLYMKRQEIGMDLVEVVKYLHTFYPEAPELYKTLSTSNDRKIDMPFTGNLTIAVGDKVKDVEKSADGIDVWPLLDLWANSFKIEAGFGRYMQVHYDATADGEAKDLQVYPNHVSALPAFANTPRYRLFGRCVQPDRRCSGMNTTWRTILRTRSLAAVRIHRKPASTSATPPAQHPAHLFVPIVHSPRPYIHILFRPDTAEPWMNKEVSAIPHDWLKNCGFSGMEYFDVKVGVVSVSEK